MRPKSRPFRGQSRGWTASAEFGEAGEQLVDLTDGRVRHESGEGGAADLVRAERGHQLGQAGRAGPDRHAAAGEELAHLRRTAPRDGECEHRQPWPGAAEHRDVRQVGNALVEVGPQRGGVRAGKGHRAPQPLAPRAAGPVVHTCEMVDRRRRAVEQFDRKRARARSGSASERPRRDRPAGPDGRSAPTASVRRSWRRRRSSDRRRDPRATAGGAVRRRRRRPAPARRPRARDRRSRARPAASPSPGCRAAR